MSKVIIKNDTNEQYHSKKEFISSSNVAGVRTPKEYYYNKYIKVWAPKNYFDIGTACHAYILEPELFKKNIIILPDNKFPESNKRNLDGSITKKGKNKDFFDTFKSLNSGKIVFEEFWYKEVIRYSTSFNNFPDFKKLFDIKAGIIECSYYGNCKETGLKTKIRPDYIKKSVFIGDLKFCKDISLHEIYRDFSRLEYHVRAAFILDNYNHFTSENIERFVFAFAEKKEPYHMRIMELSSRDINAGREIYLSRLETLKKCYSEKNWPGFEKKSGAKSIETLELPEWVYTNINLFK